MSAAKQAPGACLTAHAALASIGTVKHARATNRSNAVVALVWTLLALLAAAPARAEDGYDLWLRYGALAPAARARPLADVGAIEIEPGESDPRILSAAGELRRARAGLLGPDAPDRSADGGILLGIPANSARLAALKIDLRALGQEGFAIQPVVLDGHHYTLVAANSGAGVLYGAFALIERMQLGQPTAKLVLRDAPKLQLRVLDHWDNLDRSVERGYAGESIWDWWRLPGYLDPRYRNYARANASIGINGAVLNNVNAQAESLTPLHITKAAAIADVLRPWGMKVYLSARFSAPIELGGLKTADPLDPRVAAWWRAKANEIYRAIPDFGGFLVKAGSEGQPGPGDYGRSHAQGANMLAAALAPHGGVVMWRAFVYADAAPDDRAKQAYNAFKPLDGQFAANVLVQVKNGPIDFQPREPFHPLFGAMPRTPLMIEFQITKEYLGFATHLVYLGPLFEETLRSDTMAYGPGSTVARVIDGSIEHHALSGMAGVANIGSDRDWTGSIFNQANWYAFGRMAWNPDASARPIARTWAELTFTTDARFVEPVVSMMMASRQAAVDYMTPLGLAHLMGTGHHYGPAPWVAGLKRPEWNPVYYHRADARGIGFDRGPEGSNALAQYAPPAARQFGMLAPAGEDSLLWFHHVGWDAHMADGQTLWDTLVRRYDRGVATVGWMNATWARLRGFVDPERYAQTAAFLRVQRDEAQWWRDASVAYFQSISRRPLPPGSPPPQLPLAAYEAMQFPDAPGRPR